MFGANPRWSSALAADAAVTPLPVAGLDCVKQPASKPAYVTFGIQGFDSPTFAEERRKLDGSRLLVTLRMHSSHLVEMDSHRLRNFYEANPDPTRGQAAFAGQEGPNCWVYQIGK